MSKQTTYSVDELVEFLQKENENETIEGNLLKKKLIRELYKKIGEPTEEEFPEEFRHAYSFNKFPGYTLSIRFRTEEEMKAFNRAPTKWCIKRPSMTKVNIVNEYTREGWNCVVQAYNVMCEKYVPHPKYKNIWVMFYVSKDVARYEYIIVEK